MPRSLQASRIFLIALAAIWLSGCATSQKAATETPASQQPGSSEPIPMAPPPSADTTQAKQSQLNQTDGAQEQIANIRDTPANPVTPNNVQADTTSAPKLDKESNNQSPSYSVGAISKTRKTGMLENPSLTEVSGMSVSLKTPGVLFAINDSGNSASVFALSEDGTNLGEWLIEAKNRDWEDMSSIWHDGRAYLIIGDTGDNLNLHRYSTLHLVEEPTPGLNNKSTLTPAITLKFSFEDGPRNVEAFAVAGDSIFLISKEPVNANGPAASNLYELSIPAQFNNEPLIARKVTRLPLPSANFESKLAAAMAGVDLNHVTSMDIDVASNTAYLLTYRHVIRIQRQDSQSWAEALSTRGKRIHSHDLEQAEALAIASNHAVWFTSEKRPAPLWAIPISPPL